MTVISINGISLSFGAKTLLEDVSFSLNENDRLGIVGANGCGKSSLLSIIYRTLEPSAGQCYISSDVSVGMLTQDGAFEVNDAVGITALEQMYGAFGELLAAEARIAELAAWLEAHDGEAGGEKHSSITREYTALHERFIADGGAVFRPKCRSVLERMGFDAEAMSLPVTALSGGQRTRLALSRQLCREPDILLLDEPTNHLDTETLTWLEGFLASYKKCIIAVSHDRHFLDKVTNKTLMIEHRHAKLYRGGYTASAEQRRTDREIYERHYRNQQREIARQEAYIEQQRRWNRERNIIAAESRQKLLDKMVKLDAPQTDEKTVKMRFTQGLQSGNDVLSVRSLGFSYGATPILSDISFSIKRAERVFIVGPNGCGKSTLIKLLLEKLRPTRGIIDFGHNLRLGYYDQENQCLTETNTVLEELWSRYPTMKEHEVRGALASFLFRGDDVFKEISVLSGGERARLTLVKLMLSQMNLLVLDEPTNHLDIGSREALEEAISGYDGTVICVSHDRTFISKLATRILGFDEGGRLHDVRISRIGAAWEEWQGEAYRLAPRTAAPTASAPTAESNKEAYLRSKKEAAEARRAEARLQRLKKEEAQLDAELEALNAELYGEAASDYVRAAEISARIEAIEERLLEIYEETDA